MAVLIDTHAHLDDEQFAGDLPAVLERARAAGVAQIVAVATTAPSSAACVALAAESSRTSSPRSASIPTTPPRPRRPPGTRSSRWPRRRKWSASARRAWTATGTTRRFRCRKTTSPAIWSWAGALNKPVVIHCREADADVLRMLRADFDRHGPIRGVMHSFVGDAATAEACLAMGLYLSFAGMLTYKNAQALREVAAKQPLERLLVETDCPYLSPVPLRGKRNEPANVVHTAACLAGLHGVTPEALAERTTRNARGLFGLASGRREPAGGPSTGTGLRRPLAARHTRCCRSRPPRSPIP